LFHQRNVKYCLEKQSKEAIPELECEYCNKSFGTKYTLKTHWGRCSIKKEYEEKQRRKEIRDEYNLKIKKIKRSKEKESKEKDGLIKKLQTKNKELEQENERLRGTVEGMQNAPDKRTIYNTAIHPKLVNLPVSNIPALTQEFVERKVSEGILTYDKAARGYSGMLEAICELITHENDQGIIERNYVCTDVSRNSFHRLLESKKWRADKGGRYLNSMLDTFQDVTEKYKDKAYDMYDGTSHDSPAWRQVDWERKNISKLYSGVVCREGTDDRGDLVNALRKDISKRAYV